VQSWLTLAAAKHPDRPAIEGPAGTLTYRQLAGRAAGAAGALRALGVGQGDQVALALANPVELVVALHACLLLGAPAVPIDLRLGEREQAARAAQARIVVREPLDGGTVGEPSRAGAPSTHAHVRADAPAAVMHTSGTTAAPRSVPLSHANFLASARGSAIALGLDREERWLCPLPLTHVGGLSIPIRSAIYATTAVLRERFDTHGVLAELMDPARRITLVSLVPTMLARLLDAGLRRPPTLRWALLGGAPIPPALLERARAAAVPVAPTYGMTEACSQIATFGWPLPGVELRLAGAAGEGERSGEILVRGPVVSTACLDGDGWLHTGDLGAFDERGRLSVIGRLAETVITGGENVAPAEVEAVLLEHPEVADAAVVGRRDPEWGEALVALIVARDGARASPDELRRHCRARLAAFKVPKRVEFVDALPRSVSGKLLRRQLR
jgi:O-succinylbenzoic acid--CoA ligase